MQGFEPALHKFVGGVRDGEEIIAAIPSTRNVLFRSRIKGDDGIYYHAHIGSSRYYKILGYWRWEGLDTFDVLLGTKHD